MGVGLLIGKSRFAGRSKREQCDGQIAGDAGPKGRHERTLAIRTMIAIFSDLEAVTGYHDAAARTT
ncbi:hypothetical protein [Bradyrhizobium lablabi]|uniref:hypothetical protein n=1 Tax=Bradyrhizobium lablabi TaxID=722472 RepID=UPI001BA8AC68|nr:hypothetical protein [Bradyrhizobium lablabi]MBR0694457.1 hypothetical protein [Bradyrhizobium lablabi]